MDLQAIRDFVRGHIDLETEDLPDVVLDVFIREGSRRIEQAEKRWPFYEADYSLTTVVGQSDYSLETDVDGGLADLAAIRGARWTLRSLGRDEGDDEFPRNTTQTGEPAYYSVWGDTLRLYPEPNDVYTLEIRGYRDAEDWVALGAGAEPDLPVELHNTIAMWALARAYAQQDDPEMASFFERQFADEISLFRRRLNDTPAPQPIVLNGHTRTRSWPARLRYSFE